MRRCVAVGVLRRLVGKRSGHHELPSNAPQKLGYDETKVLEMIEEMHEDPDAAREMVREFPESVRREIAKGWLKKKRELQKKAPPPSYKQLYRLALLSGIPMIGFGFMDNAVMIVAGDYIDTYFCVHLGLTTLFAAALGNIVSDVAGVATAAPIEAISRNMGFKGHGLTAGQLRYTSVMLWKYTGTAIGVSIGCILGMFPLFWPAEWRLWETRAEAEAHTCDEGSSYESEIEEMWHSNQH